LLEPGHLSASIDTTWPTCDCIVLAEIGRHICRIRIENRDSTNFPEYGMFGSNKFPPYQKLYRFDIVIVIRSKTTDTMFASKIIFKAFLIIAISMVVVNGSYEECKAQYGPLPTKAPTKIPTKSPTNPPPINGDLVNNRIRSEDHLLFLFKPDLMLPKVGSGNVCSTLVMAPHKTIFGLAS
jgi:hypothetical protein